MTIDELCILVKEWEPTDKDIENRETRILKQEEEEEVLYKEEQNSRRNVERRKYDYYDL
jgi:hypothetical protein